MLCILFTNLQIHRSEDGAALAPHQLKVPPPLTPAHAPQQQFLVATPAPVGLNVQGSGHQLWCQESDCGSSKVRGSSSFMIDPHSCDRCRPRGLTSCSVSPCLSAMPLDSDSGPTSPCPSASSC